MSDIELDHSTPSRDQIEALIKAGDPEGFIGLEETAFFEVRDHRYDTAAQDRVKLEKAKQTFATDVSTIANSGGGFIVMGLTTSNPPGTRTEYVKSVKGVKKDLIDFEALRNILREHTVPRITLESLEYGFMGNDTKPVLWLKIPDAKVTGQYPVLIRRAKWGVEHDDFLKGEMFALYHRDGAENLLENAEIVQQKLAVANQVDTDQQAIASARYLELSEKIDKLTSSMSTEQKLDEGEITRSFLAVGNSLENDQGIFYILAKPKLQVNFQDFWSTKYEKGSLYYLIKNPPTLRSMGWGLDVASSEMPSPKGNSWEIRNGSRKVLSVSKSGDVFGAMSVEDVLNWGTNDYLPSDKSVSALVNEVALTEYIYNYLLFLSSLGDLNGGIIDYDVYYGFDIPQGTKLAMLSPERFAQYITYDRRGSLKSSQEWADVFTKDDSAEMAAARYILDITKGGFSIIETPLPIHDNSDGVRALDPDFYLKILR